MKNFEQQFRALKPEDEQDPQQEIVEKQEKRDLKMERTPMQEDETSVSYLGVRLEKAQNQDGEFVPQRDKYQDYINDRFSMEFQKKIAISFLEGDPILVEGGTSIGKTTTVKKMAADLGWEVHYANLNGATDVEDLMGRYIPNPQKTSPEDPEYIFADGKVTSGLRQENGKTKVIILDELNAAAPNILIRLHEVLDALERDGDIVLSEDASDTVSVNKEQTKVISLMNPPGKGYLGREPLDPAQLRRWVYQKEVTNLPEDTFSYSTDALFNLAEKTEEIPQEAFLISQEQAVTQEQLAEIPGMGEILEKYKEFHKVAKEMLAQRHLAEDQPQVFSYDDRMEPKRVRNFVLRFYNGDINETFQNALRYYYSNKLESEQDRQKLQELILNVKYTPKIEESKRRGLEDAAEEKIGAIKKAGIKLEGSVEEQMAEVLELMGEENIFNLDKAADVFGVSIEDVPEIPFTQKELQMMAENNEMLILEVPDMTMKDIQDAIRQKADTDAMKETGGLRFLNNEIKEKYFDKVKTVLRWRAISKNSDLGKNQTAPIQLKTLIETLQKRYKEKEEDLPEKYQKAIEVFKDEFVEKITETTGLTEVEIKTKTNEEIDKAIYNNINSGKARKKLVVWLENSEIAKLLTPTATEYFYDFASRLLSAKTEDQKKQIDKDYQNYSRIYQSTSTEGLVAFGDLGSDGVSADDWDPDAWRDGGGRGRFFLPQFVALEFDPLDGGLILWGLNFPV